MSNSSVKRTTVIESLVSGSISSAVTTTVYQPLELLKTRIQLDEKAYKSALFGRATKSAITLIKAAGPADLWKGTGASLLRSVPGVGLYYTLLNVLQANFSRHTNKPDDASQAFYFGLTARSIVSFTLLPITVVKVRYESGQYIYPSLTQAVKAAYSSSSGWVGMTPTILRDSLFSGIYYMCYTAMKSQQFIDSSSDNKKNYHLKLFAFGIVSGLLASVITNPIDVLKTNIQATSSKKLLDISMRGVASKIMHERGGLLRFYDGLVPRSARRTLISATTWTFYELIIDFAHTR